MSNGPIWEDKEGVFLKVLVKTRSKERDFISELTEDYLILNIKSPPRGGKANIELVKQMAKFLGVSTGDVALIAGHKSREKTVKVHGLGKEQVIGLVTNDK